MTAENEKADNINSLCKKYFTPELCDEPVTESKATLERKLWVQLEKYAHKVARNYFSLTTDDCEDIFIETISESIKNWNKAAPKTTYTAYYTTALKNNLVKANNNAKQKEIKEISIDKPIPNKSSSNKKKETLNEIFKDYAPSSEDLYILGTIAKQKFKFIDKIFRMKKRDVWWKALLTWYFYDDLHKYFELLDEPFNRYSFIDCDVYNSTVGEELKDIAQYLKKDKGQLSKALNNFLTLLSSSTNVDIP